MNTRRIFVSCKLSQGSFSGELFFSLKLDAGKNYNGFAPRRDCRKQNGDMIAENELGDAEVDGKLVARLIGNGGDIARVALPDGEAVLVPVDTVSERESEIAHVPV